jgi:hypothetical protein
LQDAPREDVSSLHGKYTKEDQPLRKTTNQAPKQKHTENPTKNEEEGNQIKIPTERR